ncbi:MAG: ASKHA domain-containing protein [Chloroflexota bacterium]|nr:ASKHA domain-containing protein [Chloroflexota bacterium]
MDRIEVTVLPTRKVIKAQIGNSILQILHEADLDIESPCAGEGICGKCKVQVLQGQISSIEEEEAGLLSASEITQGIRLACRAHVLGDVKLSIVVPGINDIRILEQGNMPEFTVDPNIRKVFINPNPPSLQDNSSDIERIEEELKISGEVRLDVLRSLPVTLRESEFKITCVLSGEKIIGIEEGDTTDKGYGVAVDIGTTTVVASVIDLNTGREIGTASALNAQVKYGSDVLSRIQQTRRNLNKVGELKGMIVRTVNSLIGQICAEQSIDRKYIYELVAAGNSTMMHLFLGISPSYIGVSPYAPVFRRGLMVKARELEIDISEFGEVYCLPIASGYVGADIVAGIMATELHKANEPSLLIDIGTNGEIAFSCADKLVACSCAAGPAFEGANISCGMMAAEGAIEAVRIGDSVRIKTIGNKASIGICGSGTMDVVAELLKCGAMNTAGRLLSQEEFLQIPGRPAIAHRLWGQDRQRKFILVEHSPSGEGSVVHISQDDLRQVQLAKGALRSGIEAILITQGVELGDLSKVFLAGAFGKKVRSESLATIGLIPEELASNIILVGNSSKAGATMALLSRKRREEAEAIAERIQYLELSDYPNYERLFASCLVFPEKGGRAFCHTDKFGSDRE